MKKKTTPPSAARTSTTHRSAGASRQPASEEELRRLASFPAGNPNPVIEIDEKGTVIYANAAAYREAELAGRGVEAFIPQDIDGVSGGHAGNAPAKGLRRREVEIGDRIFLLSICSDPALRSLRLYAYDVTDQKRVEQALKIKDSAIAASMNGIALSDLDGRLTYVNSAFLALWGYAEAAEVIGRNTREFWQFPMEADRLISELGAEGQWRGELRAIRRDGSVFPVEISASFVRDDEGYPLCMMGAFIDISARKQAEEALRFARRDLESRVQERTAALRDAHHELATILESISDAFFAVDREWRFTYLNGEAVRLFGRSTTEAVGACLWHILAPEAADVILPHFERAHAERLPVQFEADVPLLGGWVEVRAYPSPGGLSVFVHDIGSRKEMERHLAVTDSLLKLYTQAESKKKYLDEAVAVVRRWLGCGYLGLRVADGQGRIPFAAEEGYDAAFLMTESPLVLGRDACVCTRVALGRADPEDREVTTAGRSFFCNDTASYRDALTGDARSRFRGVCIDRGFRSLAVVPLRHRDRILGAIHAADVRPDMLPLRAVESLEQCALIIGEALFRFDIEAELQSKYLALRESAARFRTVFEDVRDVILTLSDDGVITSLNPSFSVLTGHAAEDWTGKPFSGLLHPDDVAFAEVMLRRIGEGRQLPLFELRVRTAGGEDRAFEFKLSPRSGGSREILGIARDVTERKRSEEERIRLAAAVESSADAVVITEPEQGVILYVNKAFERITGFAKEEVLGSALPLPGNGVAEAMQRDGVWRGSLVGRKKDGTTYHEDCTISPVLSASGRIISTIFVKRDVTEKLRLEAMAESVSMMDNIGSIFAGVRHEIGNPINSVNMLLGIVNAKLDELPREKLKEYLGRMGEQIERVEYILSSLKSFNLYETQEQRTIVIASFLESFLPLVRTDFAKRRIELTVSVSPNAVRMRVDPRALQQVLLNVLTNAADALEGRQEPVVRIAVSREKARIVIRVEDSGTGIAPERIRDVFKPFYTTKPRGTGLGLVIVRKMLAMMQGTVDLASEKGRGTTVTITVPEGHA
ncbi:MAG: PAS domain S-box protein [Nitrospiraceae bacterium]|nr:PAS domain S-box protein [Nitrospiraceae bacterium]